MPAVQDLTQVEKDKLEIDPKFDFRKIAQRPFEDITTNEIGMFKWCGVYHQLQKGFFMIRLRVPGGLMTSEQVERAGDLADTFGQSLLCITTRQCLQFHWIRKEDIYKVIEGMEEVGVLTQNACGDVSRNVVTCSLQGVCPNEIGDTRKMLDAIADHPEILEHQRNLPRKHKISVAGCGRACGQTLMNCQGWYPVTRKKKNGSAEIGWKYHAGGGLGARPYMAKPIFDWVPEELVVDVTLAATEIFRRHGNRRKRAYARLKILVDRLGPKGFGDKVLELMRERGITGIRRIKRAQGPANVGDMFLDGQMVIAQKQKGFNTVRVIIERSEFSGKQARQFAAWARKYGNGEIMFTSRQNLELRFVPDAELEALVAKIKKAGYTTEGYERIPDSVACVGTTMCNLAVSDTPNTYRHIANELGNDRKLWQTVGPLRINMNGCPNACAQHWIADIGLRGTRKREEVGSDEGFSVYVGGKLSGAGHIAEYVCDVVSADVVPVIRQMLNLYLKNRKDITETFGDYTRRLGGGKIGELLGAVPADDEPVNVRNLRLEPIMRKVFKDAARIKKQ